MSAKKKKTFNKKLIADRVKYLRRLGAPLTTSRGYDLRRISDWTYQRLAAIDRYSEQLDVFIEETMPLTGALYVMPKGHRIRSAIVRTYYRNTPKPKWLRGEIVPYMGTDDIHLSVDKDGNLIYRDNRRNIILIPLDPVQLATNLVEYFNRLYSYMLSLGARAFVLKAGNNYFKKGGYNGGVFTEKERGLKLIQALMNRYSDTGDWLHKIEAHLIDEEEYESRAEASGFVRALVAEHNADTDAIKEERYKEIRKMLRRNKRKKSGPSKNLV